MTPHVAAKAKGPAIGGRTARHAAYSVSQRIRKRIEEAFGWGKTVGPAAFGRRSLPNTTVDTEPGTAKASYGGPLITLRFA